MSPDDLPEHLRSDASTLGDVVLQIPPGGIDLERVEEDLIREALERTDWNQTRAAKFLGLTRNTLIIACRNSDCSARKYRIDE